MDMGVTCPFIAEGQTADEAVQKLSEHAAVAHPEVVQKMAESMTPGQMKEAMMAQVKDAVPPAEPQVPTM